MRGRTLEEYKQGQMKDPEFKKAWDSLDSEFKLMESMIRARERAGITQAELARKLWIRQIPRLLRLLENQIR